mgnify:CR=1 FL=1
MLPELDSQPVVRRDVGSLAVGGKRNAHGRLRFVRVILVQRECAGVPGDADVLGPAPCGRAPRTMAAFRFQGLPPTLCTGSSARFCDVVLRGALVLTLLIYAAAGAVVAAAAVFFA